jgi:hypothetical protein
MVRNMLGLQDPSMLLAAAELVEQRLREHNELGRWLSDAFQPLQPEDPTVIRLLKRLVSWNVPLVTTNYDGLIEAVIRSYEAIRNSQHPQDVLKALGMMKSFLFVGCGGATRVAISAVGG